MLGNWKFLLIALVVLFSGCSDRPPKRLLEKFSESRNVLGTVVKLDVCHERDRRSQVERAVEKVWNRIEEISFRLDPEHPDGDLYRINSAYPDSVQVNSDTYHLIKSLLEYSRITAGAIDAASGPLADLWREAEKKDVLPTAAELAGVRPFLGSKMIEFLSDRKVQLRNGRARLDLSLIADGFSADEAARTLHSYGFSDFLVDTTGELYASGNNCEGNKWRVGIRDPRNPSQILEVVELQNQAVASSGAFERSFTVSGRRFPAILDPRTGKPPTDVLSATVIGPLAESADALSAGLTVMPPESGTALINTLGSGWASLIYSAGKDGTMSSIRSRNFNRYRVQAPAHH